MIWNSSLVNKQICRHCFCKRRGSEGLYRQGAGGSFGSDCQEMQYCYCKSGGNGSYIRKGTEEIKVSAISVQKVVDTTGAGDYFASGFLYGLTCGYSLDKCAKIGSILSGNVIQVIGTTIPQERWDEIKLNINRILAE